MTNSEDNLRVPGEWEPHRAVWLAWPHDQTTFGALNEKDEVLNPERLEKVESTVREIVEALSGSELVRLLVPKGFSETFSNQDIEIVEVDYADIWTRDYMPTIVKSSAGKLKAVKWIYDAYGEKFEELIKDNEVWGKVHKDIETIDTDLVLEAGAIESNGSGTILTTDECLLKRNSTLSKEAIEKKFEAYLGAKKILWLSRGLTNDHTDGHIDEIARFVSPSKIVCAYEEDARDENYEILKKNYEDLCSFTDQDGRPFEVVKLPMPHMTYANGEKAPVSYANFYIGNSVVLATVFGDINDHKAIEVLQNCFPDKKVIPINCSELIYGGGAIHCITSHEPI